MDAYQFAEFFVAASLRVLTRIEETLTLNIGSKSLGDVFVHVNPCICLLDSSFLSVLICFVKALNKPLLLFFFIGFRMLDAVPGHTVVPKRLESPINCYCRTIHVILSIKNLLK